MFFPPGTAPTPSDVVNVQKAVQGVERGAAAAVSGAVHDVLGMPQAIINIFYNFGGFVVGNVLIFAGLFLMTIALFGDVVKDGLHEAAQAIDPDAGKPKTVINKVVETAGTVAGTAALL